MRRQRNADATRKRRVNARRYVSRRKAMSYHPGFSGRTDGYFAFRVNSIVAKNCTAVFIRLLLRNNRYSNGKKNDKMQIAFWNNISHFSISTILHIPRLTRILCQCMNLYKNSFLCIALPNFHEILHDVFILLLIFLILTISHINYINSFTVPKITNLPRIDVKRMFY